LSGYGASFLVAVTRHNLKKFRRAGRGLESNDERTFARRRTNDEDAPLADLRWLCSRFRTGTKADLVIISADLA
jgi:hypothetical protein